MRRKLLSLSIWIILALVTSPSFMARSQESHTEPKTEEWRIRSLMSDWVAAYKNLAAKQLAALRSTKRRDLGPLRGPAPANRTGRRRKVVVGCV